MIKRVITNDFLYKNECKEFNNDSYTRYYNLKIYFLGVLILNKSLHENVNRADLPTNNIGFK